MLLFTFYLNIVMERLFNDLEQFYYMWRSQYYNAPLLLKNVLEKLPTFGLNWLLLFVGVDVFCLSIMKSMFLEH